MSTGPAAGGPDVPAALLAAADRERAEAAAAVDEVLIPQARDVLTAHDPTVAWALLRRELRAELDTPQRTAFLAGLLAELALRAAADTRSV